MAGDARVEFESAWRQIGFCWFGLGFMWMRIKPAGRWRLVLWAGLLPGRLGWTRYHKSNVTNLWVP